MGDRFLGILNGIDDDYWNPATDPFITAHFSPSDPSPKARCKRGVQRTYGLPQRARVPLVAMSARRVEQKGLDLILADDHLLEADAQFVFLGRGEPRYEQALVEFAGRAPDRVIVPLGSRSGRAGCSRGRTSCSCHRSRPCGLTRCGRSATARCRWRAASAACGTRSRTTPPASCSTSTGPTPSRRR
jgi:glycogen synthase